MAGTQSNAQAVLAVLRKNPASMAQLQQQTGLTLVQTVVAIKEIRRTLTQAIGKACIYLHEDGRYHLTSDWKDTAFWARFNARYCSTRMQTTIEQVEIVAAAAGVNIRNIRRDFQRLDAYVADAIDELDTHLKP